MLCDQYKGALTESAFGAAALPKSVREHVDACTDCAASLAAQQALAASLDAGLRSRANAVAPSNFDHRVQAALQREASAERKPHSMLFAFGSAVAAAVLMGVVVIPRLNLSKRNGPQSSVVRDISASSGPHVAIAEGPVRAISNPTLPTSEQGLKLSGLRKTLPPRNTVPEVLVPAGQVELLVKYMDGVAARRPQVTVAASRRGATEVKPMEVPAIEISELVVTPLPDLRSN